jgi:hypothetical protein
MTSPSESPLRDAAALIADIRDYLERIDYAATGWEGVELYDRVCGFLDQHREHLQSAGGP